MDSVDNTSISLSDFNLVSTADVYVIYFLILLKPHMLRDGDGEVVLAQ